MFEFIDLYLHDSFMFICSTVGVGIIAIVIVTSFKEW